MFKNLSQVLLKSRQLQVSKLTKTYSTASIENLYDDIRTTFKYMPKDRTVSLVGVPVSIGQPLDGVDKGPEELRRHGLVDMIKNEGWAVNDIGDLPVLNTPETDAEHHQILSGPAGVKRIKCAGVLSKINEQTADATYECAKKGDFVLTLGGDHSIAIGSIAGILKARPETGIIWVDAHSDINTPYTSGSGNIHGMVVSFLMKHPECADTKEYSWLDRFPTLQDNRIAYVGLRDLDIGERRILKQKGIKAFTMHEVDKFGIGKVMEMAVEHVRGRVDRPLHLSMDIDGVDPMYAPSTGTRVGGGLSYREAYYVCETLCETGLLSSMDLVEVNSQLGDTPEDAKRTIKLANSLVCAALGNRIL